MRPIGTEHLQKVKSKKTSISLGPEQVHVLNRISTVYSSHILSFYKPQRELSFSLYSRILVNSFIGDRSLLHLVGACWSRGEGMKKSPYHKSFLCCKKKSHFLLDNFSVELRGGFLCALTPPPPLPSFIINKGCRWQKYSSAPTYLIIIFSCIEMYFRRLASLYE
jgi:hypothetical protein